MRIHLVTGGAGFLGSHLIDRLMEAGDEVICLDNYFTGRKRNIARWIGHSRFELIRHDVTEPIKLDQSGEDCQDQFSRYLQHAGPGPAGGGTVAAGQHQ